MKKFFEKLKSLFKNNKKLSTMIMVFVLSLTTLGTGIGMVVYNGIAQERALSQTETPLNDEDDIKTLKSAYWSDPSYHENIKKGSGTEASPYLIENAAQLARFAYLVNDTSEENNKYRTAYYKLATDINISAYYWVPISNKHIEGYNFSGVFDGDGHTIKGMKIDATTSIIQNYTDDTYMSLFGFFGCTQNAIIRNTIFKDATVSVNADGFDGDCSIDIGIAVAYPYDGGEISNCHVVNGSIVYDGTTQRNKRIGGLVGTVMNETYISNCSVVASFDVNNADYCGGISAGISGWVEMSDCYYSKGNQSVAIKNTTYAGLISGACGVYSNIYRCYSDSTGVDLDSTICFGGIVGYIYNNCEMVSCLARNGYFVNKSTKFGALAGNVFYTSAVISCTYELYSDVGDTMGVGDVVGIDATYDANDNYRCYGGDGSTCLDSSFYTGATWLGRGRGGTPWDLTNVWFLEDKSINTSKSLPILRSQIPEAEVNYIEEIWDSASGTFDEGNLIRLVEYASGVKLIDTDLTDVLNKVNSKNITAKDMKNFTIRGKSVGDISVELAGEAWTPTYLSKDVNGNLILTLWAEENIDGMDNFVGQVEDVYSNSATGDSYPSNMYGTSWIRAVFLNNGGGYKAYYNTDKLTTAEKSSDSVFAPYTMGELTNYIVKPKDVSWQKTQYATSFGRSYDLPNEGLSGGKFFSGTNSLGRYVNFNYTGKSGYNAWGDDYIWLPSITETGTGAVNTSYYRNWGIWQTSDEQRFRYGDTRLRSGDDDTANYNYVLVTPTSDYRPGNGWTIRNVGIYVGVRPALHLNITKAFEQFKTQSYIGEIWDDAVDDFNQNELLKLVEYTSNTTISSASDLEKKIDEISNKLSSNITAKQMQSYTAGGKEKGKDIAVRFGGLSWTPTYLSKDTSGNVILTLWLTNSAQLAGEEYSGGTFDSTGAAPWACYGQANFPNFAYPDNMYGTSYMRSIVLNNGGEFKANYLHTTLSYAMQDPKSPFALFTMNDNLTKYLVTPSNVSWQISGQLAKNNGFPYNAANENLRNPTSGFPTGYDYQDKDGYTAWGYDYLWLPSLTETGYIGKSGTFTGVWNTSIEQRENQQNYTWLRSGYLAALTSTRAAQLTPTGAGAADVSSARGVRPALHLNLTKACKSINFDYVDEILNTNTYKFNYEPFMKLIQMTSGQEITDLTSLIDETLDVGTVDNRNVGISAADMRAFTTGGKKAGNDIIVKAGGVEWTPVALSKAEGGDIILTLWLKDSLSIRTILNRVLGSYSGDLQTFFSETGYDEYGEYDYGYSYYSSHIREFMNETIYRVLSNPLMGSILRNQADTYVVDPKDVIWQKRQKDSWNNGNFSDYTPQGSYATVRCYDGDALNTSDYLWVPSKTEVESYWKTSANQNANCGDTWLRSAYAEQSMEYIIDGQGAWLGDILDEPQNPHAYYITQNGLYKPDTTIDDYKYVKPAFHLNLTAVATKIKSDGGDKEWQNPQDNEILTKNDYSAMIRFHADDSWTDVPEKVTLEVVGSGHSQVIVKGEHWFTSLSKENFTEDQIIRVTVEDPNHDYYVSFGSKPDPTSSPGQAELIWEKQTNVDVYLYVCQRYTITYEQGNGIGDPPPLQYKAHSVDAVLAENTLTRSGYLPDGWNTSPTGDGRTYKNGEKYTDNKDITFYPNWKYGYVRFTLHIVTLDKNGNVSPGIDVGGTIEAHYSIDDQGVTVPYTSTYADAENLISALANENLSLTAIAKKGFVFLGFSETNKTPQSETAPNADYTTFLEPDVLEIEFYAFFKQMSDNKLLWTEEDGGYWYFEDGEYPRSEVTDGDLNVKLNAMTSSTDAYTLQFNNGTEGEIKVYEYDSEIDEEDGKYALVEVNGVSKWFVVEPIRWRVSAYGVQQDQVPELWKNYGDTKALVAVSNDILFASIMTPEKIDDSEETNSNTFWLNKYLAESNFNFEYYDKDDSDDNKFMHSQDSFLAARDQNVSKSEEIEDSASMAVYSQNDKQFFEDTSAKLTEFASFLLYGTTAYAGTTDAYWTRDLEGGGRSEYGCGVVVTGDGRETLRWLNQMCGVRLTYYCVEVSRY